MSQIRFYLDEDAGKKSLANGLRNVIISHHNHLCQNFYSASLPFE